MTLETRYLGLALRSPLVASASPLNGELPHLRALEEAGAGAVVLPSLFQEQIEAPQLVLADGPYGIGTDAYLELIRRAKAALVIPVIASLNGDTASGWTDHAALLQEAGADALELNIYHVPVDLAQSGAATEQRYLDVLAAVRAVVQIPVAVKMPPYFSAIGHMAQRFVDAGANGLVLFNRYLQPDIDLAHLRLSNEMALSRPAEMRLPLLWTAVLAERIPCSLAGSTGVETVDEVVKYLLAGADVVMTTAAVLRHGPGHIGTLCTGLRDWLQAHDNAALDEVRGMLSHARLQQPGSYERTNYLALVENFTQGYRT
ncbi:MAG TPA: dihydroorotate dehydrogenase-like protein [Burkholderiaceae bacterium]